MYDWTEMSLILGIILAVYLVLFLIRSLLHKIKNPNGKAGGVLSYSFSILLTVILCIAIIQKDWFLTGLLLICCYLVAHEQFNSGQHYLYQIVLSGIFAIGITFTIFYFYSQKHTNYFANLTKRTSYENMPARAVDDRDEADSEPGLELDDS